MSQAQPPDGDLQAFLVEHREAFETLTAHDDEKVAELFGEVPLQLIDDQGEEQ